MWYNLKVDRCSCTLWSVFPDPKRPTVRILQPYDEDQSSSRVSALLCLISGFYPAEITVNWMLNGHKIDSNHFTNSPVGSRSAGQEYHMYSELTFPKSGSDGGDYSCVVNHQSSKELITSNNGGSTPSESIMYLFIKLFFYTAYNLFCSPVRHSQSRSALTRTPHWNCYRAQMCWYVWWATTAHQLLTSPGSWTAPQFSRNTTPPVQPEGLMGNSVLKAACVFLNRRLELRTRAASSMWPALSSTALPKEVIFALDSGSHSPLISRL